MSYPSEQIRYSEVLRSVFGGLLVGDAERDAWVTSEAQELHGRMVVDSIRDVSIQAVILSQAKLPEEAVFHLRYGLSVRAKFIWIALRRIMEIAPPGAIEALPIESVETLANDLNSLYVNLRGALDNVAWAIRALGPREAVGALSDGAMDLFGRRFLEAVGSGELSEILGPFRDWYSEMKGRRDPAAHRIPLSVPPAALDDEAQVQYANLLRLRSEALGKAFAVTRRELDENPGVPLTMKAADEAEVHFAEARQLLAQAQQIGEFPGLLVHHPEEPPVPIYPTVPEDVAQLVAIFRRTTDFIRTLAPDVT